MLQMHVISGRFPWAISMVEKSSADLSIASLPSTRMLTLRESILHVAPANMTLVRKRLHSWFCPLEDGLAISVRLGLNLQGWQGWQGLQAVRTKPRTCGIFEIPLSRSRSMLLIPFCGFIVLIEALESQKGDGDDTPSSA